MNTKIKHEFVELIPKELEENKLYICEQYEVAVHKCMCGCGIEVITPISKGEWTLTKLNDLVSLHPSMANRFPCKSHYWIKDSQVVWC